MDTTDLPVQDVQTVWKHACAALQLQLSPAVYNTWIVSNPLTNVRVVSEQSVIGTITSPTAFHSANLQKNLAKTISGVLSDILAKTVDLEFKVGEPQVRREADSSNQPDPQLHPQSQMPQVSDQDQAHGPLVSAFPSFPNQNQDQPVDSTSRPPQPQASPYTNTSSGSPRVEDLFSRANVQSSTVDRALVISRQVGLRPDYTFTTFAVSTTNEMAHAAATAVSNSPGGAYNPLFLYGGVGVGKTHLMHAIGNNILRNNPDTKIIYCTGEEFTNEIVSAIQTKKALKFKERYRTAQVLLIDDIQFIAGKNAVQEEFFHTFNALTKQASQIVLTSDRPPHEINLLEDRLRSRFEAGLMIDIQQPSFELRTAILLIKSAALNVSIPMELAQVIASKVDSARKIEGIITSIRSEVELKKRPIDMALLEDVLKPEVEKKRTVLKVSPADVLRAVANHYHIKQTAIKGQRRVAHLVHARHVAMYLLKEELGMPFTEVGRWFSNRDHTSAMHAIKKIERDLTQDELLQRDVSALRMSLSAISR
jgi:chromosomal replication initiator protein